MRNVQMIRPDSGLVSIPLEKAVYCENCATVSTSSHSWCGLCGSRNVVDLASVLSTPPDPNPASALYPFFPVAA